MLKSLSLSSSSVFEAMLETTKTINAIAIVIMIKMALTIFAPILRRLNRPINFSFELDVDLKLRFNKEAIIYQTTGKINKFKKMCLNKKKKNTF